MSNTKEEILIRSLHEKATKIAINSENIEIASFANSALWCIDQLEISNKKLKSANLDIETLCNVIDNLSKGAKEVIDIPFDDLLDAHLFRTWVKGCTIFTAETARALANCVTEDDYRSDLLSLGASKNMRFDANAT